jgi:hypothetical protein
MSRPIDQITLHETYSPKNYLNNILNDELKKKSSSQFFGGSGMGAWLPWPKIGPDLAVFK